MNTTQRQPGLGIANALVAMALIWGVIGLCGLLFPPLPIGRDVECVVDRDAIHASPSRPFHMDGQTVLTRSDGFLHGVCGGCSGKRQNDNRTFGTILSFRLPYVGATVRGGFLSLDDAFSSYGKRRPHLVLCRLRN